MSIHVNGERYQCERGCWHLFFSTHQIDLSQQGKVCRRETPFRSAEEARVQRIYQDDCIRERRSPDTQELNKLLDSVRRNSIQKIQVPQEKLNQIQQVLQPLLALQQQVARKEKELTPLVSSLF